MTDRADTVGRIEFLVRSETRVRILEHLSDSGPTTRDELRDSLEASQSTISRAVQSLEERGWVTSEERVHRLTPVGTLVADGFQTFAETIRATERLSPFLRWFPYEEFSLDLTQLRDGEVIPSRPGDPYAPARQQTDLLRTTGEFRGFLPSIDLEGAKLVHERVLAGELSAEVIVGPDVAQTIRTGEYAALFRDKTETGRLTVLASDDDLPFYLGIGDGTDVQIGVEDDEGIPKALLEISNESVANWAIDAYREYRERSSVLSTKFFQNR